MKIREVSDRLRGSLNHRLDPTTIDWRKISHDIRQACQRHV
ncbi:MAG: hypothetical protein RI575_06105 [Balneolaceae bacterium]|nr:hypothetical protein [Balneolaceae bacterium]